MSFERTFCVYRFTTTAGDMTIKVAFLNEERLRKSGADHSLGSQLRQDWAIRVVLDCDRQRHNQNFQNWYELPEHDYINQLHHREFRYTEYCLWIHSDTAVEIIVR